MKKYFFFYQIENAINAGDGLNQILYRNHFKAKMKRKN